MGKQTKFTSSTGITKGVADVSGLNVFGQLKYESGVHRLVGTIEPVLLFAYNFIPTMKVHIMSQFLYSHAFSFCNFFFYGTYIYSVNFLCLNCEHLNFFFFQQKL